MIYHRDTENAERKELKNLRVLCASVPLCLCASVPLCLCASVPLWLIFRTSTLPCQYYLFTAIQIGRRSYVAAGGAADLVAELRVHVVTLGNRDDDRGRDRAHNDRRAGHQRNAQPRNRQTDHRADQYRAGDHSAVVCRLKRI